MREIKFRAWDKHVKVMRSGRDFVIGLDGDVLFNDIFGGVSKYEANCRDQILMQFTGLKDKNGQDIYEADIIEIDDGINKWHEPIEWNKFIGFQAGDQPVGKYVYGKNMVIVIGNIYENPELLK